MADFVGKIEQKPVLGRGLFGPGGGVVGGVGVAEHAQLDAAQRGLGFGQKPAKVAQPAVLVEHVQHALVASQHLPTVNADTLGPVQQISRAQHVGVGLVGQQRAQHVGGQQVDEQRRDVDGCHGCRSALRVARKQADVVGLHRARRQQARLQAQKQRVAVPHIGVLQALQFGSRHRLLRLGQQGGVQRPFSRARLGHGGQLGAGQQGA